MKKLIAVALLLSLFGVAVLAQKKGTPKTQKEKVSYSLGMNIGKNMKMQGIEVDQEYLVKGMRDALSNAKAAMSEKDMETAMKAFQQEMQTKQIYADDKNKKDGENEGDGRIDDTNNTSWMLLRRRTAQKLRRYCVLFRASWVFAFHGAANASSRPEHGVAIIGWI